jgi:hypothetical protein
MSTGKDDGQAPEARVYYAHRCVRDEGRRVLYLHASPNRWWTALHGSRDPIVPVRLRERGPGDPPSPYWGWVATSQPDRFCMVWPSETCLETCFPYGSQVAEENGHGRRANLVVEETAEAL